MPLSAWIDAETPPSLSEVGSASKPVRIVKPSAAFFGREDEEAEKNRSWRTFGRSPRIRGWVDELFGRPSERGDPELTLAFAGFGGPTCLLFISLLVVCGWSSQITCRVGTLAANGGVDVCNQLTAGEPLAASKLAK